MGLLRRIVYRHWHRVHPIRRLEIRILDDGLELSGRERILDLGCGKGPYVGGLERRGFAAFGVDPEPAQLAIAGRHVTSSHRLAAARGEDLPFANESFDRVVSVCVLEHTEDDRRVLAEVRRVLRPNGIFALSVDSLDGFDETLRASHALRFRCHQLYEPEGIRRKLLDAGFDVSRVDALFSGRIAAAIARFGERVHYRGAFVLLFPLLYPLLLLDRRLTRGASRGMILAIAARRASTEKNAAP